MSADLDTLLNELEEAGLKLRVENGTLRVRGEASALTPELRAALAAFKADIIDYYTPKHPHITKRYVPRIRVSFKYGDDGDDEVHDITDGRFTCAPEEAAKYQMVHTPIEQIEVGVVYDGDPQTTETKLYDDEDRALRFIRQVEENTCAGCGVIASEPDRFSLCTACAEKADPCEWMVQSRDPSKPKPRWLKTERRGVVVITLEPVAETLARRLYRRDDGDVPDVYHTAGAVPEGREYRVVNTRAKEVYAVIFSQVEKLDVGQWWYEEFIVPPREPRKKQKPGAFVPTLGQLTLSVDPQAKTFNVTLEPFSNFDVAMRVLTVKRNEYAQAKRDYGQEEPDIRIRGVELQANGMPFESTFMGALIPPQADVDDEEDAA